MRRVVAISIYLEYLVRGQGCSGSLIIPVLTLRVANSADAIYFSRSSMDRLLLVASTFCFLFGFAYTMYALGARTYRASQFNYGVILLGFLLQTGFLYVRGHAQGRCPLTNLFEVFIFLSWSVVLLYLMIGSAYRMSLMGLFTSPLVFLLQVFALLAVNDAPNRSGRIRNHGWNCTPPSRSSRTGHLRLREWQGRCTWRRNGS